LGERVTYKPHGRATLYQDWYPEDVKRFRAEVRRRFRSRTPPASTDVYSFDPGCRVVRSEMRGWALDNLGKLAPDTDERWLTEQARWYRRMAREEMKRAGEDR